MSLQTRLSESGDRQVLCDMVNTAYQECEGHLWVAGHRRLTPQRFTEHSERKELLVAERGGLVVGNHGMW